MAPPPLLTVSQVAKRLCVHEDTVRSWIQVGRLEALNIGTDERPQYRISEVGLSKMVKQVHVY